MPKAGRVRILSGEFKGRNITVPVASRPVSQIVRGACFDILGQEVKNKRILDLFAGSGALGIEALSRGASQALFIDSDPKCIRALEENILSLKIDDRSRASFGDSLSVLKGLSRAKETFDIIFLDPPYYQGMLRKALQTLEEYDILTPSGYVVGFCYAKDDFSIESAKFSIIVNKTYGQTVVLVYTK